MLGIVFGNWNLSAGLPVTRTKCLALLLSLFRTDILANTVLHRLLLLFPIGTITETSTSANHGPLPLLTSKKFFCLVCVGPYFRSGQVLYYNLICLVHCFFTCAYKRTIALSAARWLYPHCQCICLGQHPAAAGLTAWLACTFMARIDW